LKRGRGKEKKEEANAPLKTTPARILFLYFPLSGQERETKRG